MTLFKAAYPTADGTRLDDLPGAANHCGLCHFTFKSGGTLNPYGVRMGQLSSITAATIKGIGSEDSDNDGYSNDIEIEGYSSYDNIPTFPGYTPGNVNQVTGVTAAEIQAYLVPANLSGPYAAASITAYADSLKIDCLDQSTCSGCTITKWNWNFGDGQSAATMSPSHTYATAGTYSVILTVTDNSTPAKTDSETFTVTVPKPLNYCASSGGDFSYFYISKVDLGTLANSSGGSNYTDFTKTVLAPVLNAGDTYNLLITVNAQYTNWFKAYIDYNIDGDFDDAGEIIYASATAIKVPSAGGAVVIPETAKSGVTRLRIQVKNNADPASPLPCESFGYGEVEDYAVSIHKEECPTPVAHFIFSYLGNLKVQFSDNSEPGEGATIVSWLWHFGEGPNYLGSSTLQNPTFTFPNFGGYPNCLDVTNNCGKSAGICIEVTMPPPPTKDDIIGVFPSVGGLWKLENTATGFDWTRLSLQEPNMIRMGDADGNGLDDLGCLVKATQKFWIRYDNGTWVDVPASAKDMICFDLGDINKDGKADIVGSWTFGTWWKNTASGVWAKLSTMSPTYLAAGDFDADGYCDIVGLYPTLASLWIYKYNGSKWTQISKQINLNDLRTGDFDQDGKAEVLGSWNIGTWTFNPISNIWVKHSNNQASVLCAGDINGLSKDDIVGDWSPNVAGLWIKYLENNTWVQSSKQVPKDLTSGRTK
jgi:PKD repeat protein